MNKKEYNKPEVRTLEMQDLMDDNTDVNIPARYSVSGGEEGGAKENNFEDDEDEDTVSASWGIY